MSISHCTDGSHLMLSRTIRYPLCSSSELGNTNLE
uniref:Uncharacterized protein n=1 Tax=Zea mays TaxID=4577 RepID=C0HGE6_MAIZE|nr:unknown [Zea mays]